MAFAAALRTDPGNVEKHNQGYRTLAWDITNDSGSTGGAVTTNFGHIRRAVFEPATDGAATDHGTLVSGETVTVTTAADINGTLYVTGNGQR